VWLTYDGKRIKKQKTRCKPKTLEPHFNETFTFDIDPDRLPVTSLSIVVMDHDIVGQNDMIGRIAIGSSGDPTESRHWKEMLSKPQQMIERWHVLKCDI
jgi:Ca2+-dependent lipid-binding protein